MGANREFCVIPNKSNGAASITVHVALASWSVTVSVLYVLAAGDRMFYYSVRHLTRRLVLSRLYMWHRRLEVYVVSNELSVAVSICLYPRIL